MNNSYKGYQGGAEDNLGQLMKSSYDKSSGPPPQQILETLGGKGPSTPNNMVQSTEFDRSRYYFKKGLTENVQQSQYNP